VSIVTTTLSKVHGWVQKDIYNKKNAKECDALVGGHGGQERSRAVENVWEGAVIDKPSNDFMDARTTPHFVYKVFDAK
jgi:hypothetical protein